MSQESLRIYNSCEVYHVIHNTNTLEGETAGVSPNWYNSLQNCYADAALSFFKKMGFQVRLHDFARKCPMFEM